MGATHFLMTTLPKVAAEMALSVLAYKLTRVMNIVGIKPQPPPKPSGRSNSCVRVITQPRPGADVSGQLQPGSTVCWRVNHSALLASWRKAQWQWLGPDTRPYTRSQPLSVPTR